MPKLSLKENFKGHHLRSFSQLHHPHWIGGRMVALIFFDFYSLSLICIDCWWFCMSLNGFHSFQRSQMNPRAESVNSWRTLEESGKDPRGILYINPLGMIPDELRGNPRGIPQSNSPESSWANSWRTLEESGGDPRGILYINPLGMIPEKLCGNPRGIPQSNSSESPIRFPIQFWRWSWLKLLRRSPLRFSLRIMNHSIPYTILAMELAVMDPRRAS